MSVRQHVTQHEFMLDDDTTVMSTTDLKSYITHANDAFIQVSGYELHELQGSAHNIARHPDMPKEVFADMWSYLTARRTMDRSVFLAVFFAFFRIKGGDYFCFSQQ